MVYLMKVAFFFSIEKKARVFFFFFEGSIFNCAVASYKFNLNVNAQFSFLDIALLYTEFWKDSEVHFSCNILF